MGGSKVSHSALSADNPGGPCGRIAYGIIVEKGKTYLLFPYNLSLYLQRLRSPLEPLTLSTRLHLRTPYSYQHGVQ